MPYTTYQELQQEVSSWAARNDPTFASKIPSFINHTELDMERRLECEFQRASFSGTLDSSGEIVLPDRTLYVRRLSIDTNPPQDLTLIAPDQLNNIRSGSDRIPFAGYRENNVIRYAPITNSGSTYSGDVVRVADPLADGALSESNDFLDNLRDILLAGSLRQAAKWTKSYDEMTGLTADYLDGIAAVRRHHWKKRFSAGGPIRIQPDTYA